MGISQVRLAEHVGIPIQRINQIVRGKRGITAETAWLLGQALGTTPELWLNLQTLYDLTQARPARKIRPLVKKAS